MSTVDVLKHLKALLSSSSEAPPLKEILQEVDVNVLQSSSDEFLEELQIIYHDHVHYADIHQLTVFVEVLHHLQSVLSSSSIISTWFDLVLRPALRDPSLALAVIDHAKDLILIALEKAEDSPEKVGEFRRRVVDLYLLDALNEGSSDDVLEWAELDEGQREIRIWWKANLEDTLVRFGLRQPKVRHLCDPQICRLIACTGASHRLVPLFHVPHYSPPNTQSIGLLSISRIIHVRCTGIHIASLTAQHPHFPSTGQFIHCLCVWHRHSPEATPNHGY